MPLKLPQIIGHRGCAGYVPENTLEAIHTAADMGLKWVELDVKLTKDQIPIIFHDPTLERVTNGSGNVADKTLAEIKELDCGSYYGESFTGIDIPTLEEAIDVLLERDLGINLELKPCSGRDKDTAEVALDLLSSIWDDHDSLLISSYSMEALEIAADMASGWARSLVIGKDSSQDWISALNTGSLPEDFLKIRKYLELSAVSIDQEFCSGLIIRELQTQDLCIIPYGVNEAQRAVELQHLGLKNFISDYPDEIEDCLLSVH